MRVLPVTAVFDERTFTSLEEAVDSASINTARSNMAASVTKDITGCVIDSASWNEKILVLHLSNDTFLTFALKERRVEFHAEIGFHSGAICDFESEVILSFSNTHREHLWKKGELIRSRIGKTFTKIFAGTSFVYVYIEGAPILLLSALSRDDTHEDILYWDNVH